MAVAIALPARTAVAHGDVHARIDALGSEIRARPRDAGLFVQRGLLFEIDGARREAAADFDTARSIDPATPDIDLYLARALEGTGTLRSARAVTLIDGYLTAFPGRADAYLVRARARVALGQADAAARDFDHAIEHSERPSPDHYVERARVLIERGGSRVDTALDGLRAGVDRFGPVASVVQLAVETETQRGHHDAAIAWAERLPPVLRDTARWRMIVGDLHLSAGRTARALDEWRAGRDAIEQLPSGRRNAEANQTIRAELTRRLDNAARVAHTTGRVGTHASVRPRAPRWVVAVVSAAALLVFAFVLARSRMKAR